MTDDHPTSLSFGTVSRVSPKTDVASPHDGAALADDGSGGVRGLPVPSPTPTAAPSLVTLCSTLAELVAARAAADDGEGGFSFATYREADEPDTEHLSFADLFVRAKALAARLQQHVQKGDRVLILCPPGLNYIVAFFACQVAGMVAVPAYPPRNKSHLARLSAICDDARAGAVLVTSTLQRKLDDWDARADLSDATIAVDAVALQDAALFTPVDVAPDDLAFLQYTSGTTGTPKGVMVSQANVMANLRACGRVWLFDTSTRLCLWLPPFHDMGLVSGVLFPVSFGCQCHLMSPAAFLQRPLRWLDRLSKVRATHALAPNFAWQLCADSIGAENAAALDLTHLQVAASGAERIRSETLTALLETFGPAGLSRDKLEGVYGLAETVVLATAEERHTKGEAGPTAVALKRSDLMDGRVSLDATSEGKSRTPTRDLVEFVSCGRVLEGHHLRIVDPQSHRTAEVHSVGEIWLKGPSVAAGYWNKPEETDATFNAHCVDAPETGPWLRTGDLGMVIDGDVFVVGRIKDVIIARGRNHHAQDLEETANASDPILGQDRTVAFAIETDSSETVVLVHELTRSSLRKIDTERVAAAMRSALLATHDVDVGAVIFVKPARLPRTTSGKLQRAKARALYVSGELDPVREVIMTVASGADPERAALQDGTIIGQVRELVANRLGVQPEALDVNAEFAALGVDSLATAQLLEALNTRFGVSLNVGDLDDTPTLRMLAARLADAPSAVAMRQPPGAPSERNEKAAASPSSNAAIDGGALRRWLAGRLSGAQGGRSRVRQGKAQRHFWPAVGITPEPTPTREDWLTRQKHKLLLRLAGLKSIGVSGNEKAAAALAEAAGRDEHVVIVANHTFYPDGVVALNSMRVAAPAQFQGCVIAAHDYSVFGLAARSNGTLNRIPGALEVTLPRHSPQQVDALKKQVTEGCVPTVVFLQQRPNLLLHRHAEAEPETFAQFLVECRRSGLTPSISVLPMNITYRVGSISYDTVCQLLRDIRSQPDGTQPTDVTEVDQQASRLQRELIATNRVMARALAFDRPGFDGGGGTAEDLDVQFQESFAALRRAILERLALAEYILDLQADEAATVSDRFRAVENTILKHLRPHFSDEGDVPRVGTPEYLAFDQAGVIALEAQQLTRPALPYVSQLEPDADVRWQTLEDIFDLALIHYVSSQLLTGKTLGRIRLPSAFQWAAQVEFRDARAVPADASATSEFSAWMGRETASRPPAQTSLAEQ